MINLKQIARSHWVMLGMVLGLALYYFLVFRPLSKSAETLDEPLNEIWQELVDFSRESSSVRDLDLDQIKKTQESLRASLAAIKKVREKISTRVELEPEIRAKMNEPFSLIDFQNERQKRIEQLTALAKTQQVTLDAAALTGFPEYKAETRDPSVLWAQLAMVHHVLTVAINSKVGQVKNVSLLATQPEAVVNVADVVWQEIQLRIELIAPMPSAANFLSAIPLRAEEMKAAGLPESSAGKPSLFLDRLLIRKQTPEKPDEISLDLVISGFVLGPKGQLNRSQEKGALP
jgi:hypothetical protein